MGEHSYDRAVLLEACDIGDVEEIEIDQPSKEQKVGRDHTPLNSPLPKKMKSSGIEESTGEAILHAVQALTKKMEEQTELLKRFEKRIEANTAATKENKEEIIRAHNEIRELQAQNLSLKRACEEQARYKRRWNLRLTGLPEKEGEDVREVVIGILTRVVPLSVERLRDTVDTVHRLGRKMNAATSNNMGRAIIIQFAVRIVRDDVWKRSKEANVCKEMHIRFKEDFSKEDREARSKLWPLVEEARRKGKRAFLKEGYAMIDNQRIDSK